MQPVGTTPWTISPNVFFMPSLLSHMQLVPENTFDSILLETRLESTYRIFETYLPLGVVCLQNGNEVVYRNSDGIHIYVCDPSGAVEHTYYYRGGFTQELITHEALCSRLQLYISSHKASRFDLLSTRFFEELRIEIFIHKAALNQIKFELQENKESVHLALRCDKERYITVLPAFFSRMSSPDYKGFRTSVVAQVLSTRSAIKLARTSIPHFNEENGDEREVEPLMSDQSQFSLKTLHAELVIGRVSILNSKKMLSNSNAPYLEIIIGWEDNNISLCLRVFGRGLLSTHP